MLVNHTDRSLHAPIMHAWLTVTRRRFAIRSRLVYPNRIRIRNLRSIDGRNIFVRPSHMLLHRYLMLILLIVTTPATFVLDSLGFESLGVRWEVAIIIDCWWHTM